LGISGLVLAPFTSGLSLLLTATGVATGFGSSGLSVANIISKNGLE
jgi:hypothetical protein